MMSERDKVAARAEIHDSMKICYYFTHSIGIVFTDIDLSFSSKVKHACLFVCALLALTTLVLGDFTTSINTLLQTRSLPAFIGSFHVTVYAAMSLVKILRLWHKQKEVKYLLNELAELWPLHTDSDESAEVKKTSLAALKRSQMMYAFWNELGVWFYIVTPLFVRLYQMTIGQLGELIFIWPVTLPFDKHEHYIWAYAFEIYAGLMSVSCMVGSDLIFTVGSLISMLLRLLEVKIRNLGSKSSLDNQLNSLSNEEDFYAEIVEIIKVHQKLIKFQNALEETFSMLNLINVLLSSVNICCVVFSIVLLEPWMSVSNKFFLGATLTQVGILCWFADEIYTSSIGVSHAVYDCSWHQPSCSIRCRRALLLLLVRAQKPLYFTAMKFSNITLNTFTSILTTSYSYFTLIYTMYNGTQ